MQFKYFQSVLTSQVWLELLMESGYYSDPAILEHCIELKKLLISSLNTAKKKAE